MLMVRAGYGVEGRLQASNPSAEPHYHLGDDVIRPDPKSRSSDLQRQVPIAEVPGNAQQVCRFGSLDFEDRLWGSADPQVSTEVEFKTVAVDQVMRRRQVE